MAVIHHTTLVPSKLDLLTAWLPGREWYSGEGRAPELVKSGGFRLDDPAGEVGLEFMLVTDQSGDRNVTYHVPLTYRGAPFEGAENALVGTTEHGVLGTRWVYDGAQDPVLVDQLIALLNGEAEPQAQSITDTPDPTIVATIATGLRIAAAGGSSAVSTPEGTDLRATTIDGESRPSERAIVRILRTVRAGSTDEHRDRSGEVTGGWIEPDGSAVHGRLVVVIDER